MSGTPRLHPPWPPGGPFCHSQEPQWPEHYFYNSDAILELLGGAGLARPPGCVRDTSRSLAVARSHPSVLSPPGTHGPASPSHPECATLPDNTWPATAVAQAQATALPLCFGEPCPAPCCSLCLVLETGLASPGALFPGKNHNHLTAFTREPPRQNICKRSDEFTDSF